MTNTLSKNRSAFERLVQKKGADVHWHREIGGNICPCVTPEGFRDPEWHRQNPSAPVCNNDGRLVYTEITRPAGWTTNTTLNTLLDSMIAAQNVGSTTSYPLSDPYIFAAGYELNIDLITGTWTVEGELPVSIVAGPGHENDSADQLIAQFCNFSVVPVGIYDLVADTIILGRRCLLIASKSGTVLDWSNYGINGGTVVPLPSTNAESIWHDASLTIQHGILQDHVVKAFVQPAFFGTRSRSTQFILNAFGELEADDHIGIFPLESNGFEVDFSDWSDSGSDWIDFNGMRFVAITWNRVPAPDNSSVNHHWEVALRRINING